MTENTIKTLNDNELDLVCGGVLKHASLDNVIQPPAGFSGPSDTGSMFPNASDDPRHPTRL